MTLTLTTASTRPITGTMEAEGHTASIYEARAEGGAMTWKVDIASPMPMTLDFSATIAGDSIAGSVTAGMFGSWPFQGRRMV